MDPFYWLRPTQQFSYVPPSQNNSDSRNHSNFLFETKPQSFARHTSPWIDYSSVISHPESSHPRFDGDITNRSKCTCRYCWNYQEELDLSYHPSFYPSTPEIPSQNRNLSNSDVYTSTSASSALLCYSNTPQTSNNNLSFLPQLKEELQEVEYNPLFPLDNHISITNFLNDTASSYLDIKPLPPTSPTTTQKKRKMSDIEAPQLLTEMTTDQRPKMEMFIPDDLRDFKRVIYNELVKTYNKGGAKRGLIEPYSTIENGITRDGFRYNESKSPEKRISLLYAVSVRKANIQDLMDKDSVVVNDLLRFYFRATTELLTKYFDKRDNHTYLYRDIPLFVPGESLKEASKRIKAIKSTKYSKRKKRTSDIGSENVGADVVNSVTAAEEFVLYPPSSKEDVLDDQSGTED